MSIKSIIQILIHVEHYHVIEYPKQGLFNFRISLFQQIHKQRIYAIPYQQLPPLQNQNQRSNRLLLAPKIDDQLFVSTVGLVKFLDEILQLDDWVQFRLETQSYPNINCENIFLQVQLRLNSTKLHQPQNQGEHIQRVTMRLNDLQNGLFASSQAQFDSPYLSKLSFTGLGLITTFKFTKFQPFSQELSSTDKKRIKINSILQLLQLAKSLMPQVNVIEMFYTNYIKKLRIVQYLIIEKLQGYMQNKEQSIGSMKICQQFMKSNNLQILDSKNFKQYLDNFFPSQLDIDAIMNQINQIRQENFLLFRSIIDKWRSNKINLYKSHDEYQTYEKEKYGETMFKSIITGQNEITLKKQLSSKQNKKISKQIRAKNIRLNSHPIQDVRAQTEQQTRQIIFYEVSTPFKDNLQKQEMLKLQQKQLILSKKGAQLQYSQKNMLIVLCHGFQGTSYDMQLIKRWIQAQLPDANYMVSRTNQDNTEGDIATMGKRLADQIKNYIENHLDQYQQENIIVNLVGHSMGGIIARAAIPHLQQYHSNLGFFCSLSSPHLGYLNGVSGLVKVGLWAIRKWKSIQSLQQLSMQQKGNPRTTFLYDLSKAGHLRYFRKIILMSSFEDSYVSWHSARISSHRSTNSESKVERQMQQNIMGGNIYGGSVHRIDVNFNVKTNDLDSFIGRKAHIELIIREKLFKNLGINLPQLFQLRQNGTQGIFM